MIQRKQSLYLLAVAILSIIILFVPILSATSNNVIQNFNLLQATGNVSNVYYLMVINNMVVLLSVITVFLYKKRPVQFKLSNLLVLLNVFITGLAFLLPFETELGVIHTTLWAFLPLAGAAFAYLAALSIKKDEQLVRSADRIR